MREFENHVQKVKNEVYREVARHSFHGTLDENKMDIADVLNPGPKPRFRCCIYHERAVTNERVKCTLLGVKPGENVVRVLPSACNGCSPDRYVVTDMCRGCISNRCIQSCTVVAISIVDKKAMIDHEKCIECGKCKSACPYNAIADVMRPCMKVCPVDAISVSKDGQAEIDDAKCIRCGSCVQMCPFGAVQDRSDLVRVIESLRNPDVPVIAMVAPSIADAFGYTRVGKVTTAIKNIGFRDVVEVALGADIVIQQEANEFMRVLETDGVMTSSCCPAFVDYVKIRYPKLAGYISQTESPMLVTARLVKTLHPDCKTVFIGPCIAKKEEAMSSPVDYTLTFEELAGMIDIDEVEFLEESPLDNASYAGRKFAVCGGVSQSIQRQLAKAADVGDYEMVKCEGFDEIDKTMRILQAGRLRRTFIEGMACKGGCVKGPATLHFGQTDKRAFEKYCSEAYEKDPQTTAKIFEC